MKSKGLQVPTTPEDVGYITLPLTIPDTPEWRGVFCGLLYSISFGYWWDKNSGDWEQAKQIGYAVALETCRSMGICDEVEDCIKNTETIREIIREIVRETVKGGGSTGGGGGLGVGVESLENCSPDHVFGAVTGLVNYQLQAVRDALELLEVATNRIEFILDWVGDWVVVAPVIATIANWVAWVQDNVSENFEAQVTTALIDGYRCDLFCLYLDNDCQGLTSNDIAGYFLGRIGGVGLLENLEDLLNFFITGEFTGTQIVDAMMAGSIAMMVVDLDWIPFVTIPSLYNVEMVFALSADNPDPDWEILCSECVPDEWEKFFDFTIDDYTDIWTGIAPDFLGGGYPVATYTTGQGWRTNTYSDGSGYGMIRSIVFDHTVTVTEVRITGKRLGGAGGGFEASIRNEANTSNALVFSDFTLVSTTETETGSVPLTRFRVYMQCVASNFMIESIRFIGTGGAPFAGHNP